MITSEDPHPDQRHEPRRAILVVARFGDGTRRVRACGTVEEVRRFVAGEDQHSGQHRYAKPLGQGREELRHDMTYTTPSELASAIRDLLRSR